MTKNTVVKNKDYSQLVHVNRGAFYVRLDGQLALDCPSPNELGLRTIWMDLYEDVHDTKECIFEVVFENDTDGYKFLNVIEAMTKTGKYDESLS